MIDKHRIKLVLKHPTAPQWGVAFQVDADAAWIPVLKTTHEGQAQAASHAVLHALRAIGYKGAKVLCQQIETEAEKEEPAP